ncbi:retrovirus-related pol polyprotein from transposon TNT 1-94 [Tanacetum coccineum]
MAKASPTQAWLWHRRLFHLNFDYINLLSKKDVVIGLPKLKKNSSSVDRLHFRKECIDYRRIICFQLHSPWELSGFLSTLFAAPSPFPIYQWTYKRHILNVQLKEESVDSKKQDCTAKTSSEAEIRALICKLCLSHVDEDTTFKRIWLQLQQNNRCIANPPQSASINLCNPEQHSPYQAHPYSGIQKDGDGEAFIPADSNSLPQAQCSNYKVNTIIIRFKNHESSRIKTKTSAQTLIYKIFLQRYQVYQGRLLASFQDDAKYEHVGQDTRSQGGKDDQDGRIKI